MKCGHYVVRTYPFIPPQDWSMHSFVLCYSQLYQIYICIQCLTVKFLARRSTVLVEECQCTYYGSICSQYARDLPKHSVGTKTARHHKKNAIDCLKRTVGCGTCRQWTLPVGTGRSKEEQWGEAPPKGGQKNCFLKFAEYLQNKLQWGDFYLRIVETRKDEIFQKINLTIVHSPNRI